MKTKNKKNSTRLFVIFSMTLFLVVFLNLAKSETLNAATTSTTSIKKDYQLL
ncbi:MAG: hypothetical protein ACD_9C00021G0001, partial [uncultured bacterium]